MKMILTAIAAMALSAAPAVAQETQPAPKPTAARGAAMDMSKMTPEELHKHCSMMMGGRMQGRPKHDHSAERTGQAPAMTPPTEAEMKAMHEKCAAAMAEKKSAPPAKP